MVDLSRVHALDATEVVELTPVGRGAVAVVLVAGPEALAMVDQLFIAASGRLLGDVPLQRIVFGRIGGTDGEEVIACRRATKEIEIHCHGGTAAIRSLIEQLVGRGCQPITWHDWLRRTCGDPTKAAAQIALANAPTVRTAAILLDQYHGALAEAIRQIVAAIESKNWPYAARTIDSLLEHRDVGLHLAAPWRVVLTGPTNVGKSSLINAIAGFQRAIVSPQPGTTRDVVTTTTAMDGWPVELADTAGIRDPEDDLESAGIVLAEKMVAGADLVVVVDDATQPFKFEHDHMLSATLSSSTHRRIVRVLNKIDLLPGTQSEITSRHQPPEFLQIAADPAPGKNRLPGAPVEPSRSHPSCVVRTSAVTGAGVTALIAAIAESLVPYVPAPGAAVPFSANQVASLDAARAAVDAQDAAGILAALQPLMASN
jgi:tRNA modification GTPase